MDRLVWLIALRRGVWLWLSLWLVVPLLALLPWAPRPGKDLHMSAIDVVAVPSVLAKLQAHQLRERDKVQVSTKPVDTPPLPPGLQPMAPVIFHIPTSNPVFFITIDDGVAKQADAAEFITKYQLPVSGFLTIHNIESDFSYFRRLQLAGMTVQDHTVTHTSLAGLPIEYQRQEICTAADVLTQQYTFRPTLFRPPYGEYDENTQRAAAECGMKAVVWWTATMHQGVLSLQPPNTTLMPGDIVLMHFHPGLKQDIQLLLQIASQQGLQLAHLEDYLR